MARWWTKPPIILAVLGVLAVLLPARLPRMPITQHTPGAGSGEQALQEGLTTYRQLAQTQPQTYLPKVLAAALVVLGLSASAFAEEPSKASESAYNTDIRKANTSEGLTKADLAWHATHTYGWKCSEVVSKGALTPEGYFIITCANGTKLRVYPRKQRQPRITNIKGGYD